MNETAAKKSVYLDYNATTPLADVVIEEIKDALIQAWGNPSSSYREGNLKFLKNVICCCNIYPFNELALCYILMSLAIYWSLY